MDIMDIKIKKVLIANRGEIACRAIKTCKLLGIKTVSVYSEVDYNFLPALQADEAFLIGPAPSNQSYLVIDKILAAVKQSGADAVYPGYGFLSENTHFAKALEDIGVVFIGPNSKAIEAMGDKIESKRTAVAAGVSVVPGYDGVIESENHAIKISKEIGFPVILKASAGGGGKGIRIVYDEKDVGIAFSSVKNEAKKSFGDDRIFIEKFIERPRHIEIQVLADKHGNVVCLGERECSIQRNNQKVIEEAPSSFITPDVRAKMYEQSVMLAKKVGYDSAGTIEYIVDQNRNFYFLEMNTRLQVEHPVTEYITGLDMIEQMLRVADGQKLSYKQEDIKLNGWAFEARVCSEDASKNFLPSTGWLSVYQEPEKSNNIRVDTGVKEGCFITQFYDPMIAKLITYGNTRDEARNTLINALGQFAIEGVVTNIPIVEKILLDPDFASGNISTNFIKEKGEALNDPKIILKEYLPIFVCASIFVSIEKATQTSLGHSLIPTQYCTLLNNTKYTAEVKEIDDEFLTIYFAGVNYKIGTLIDFNLSSKSLSLTINEKRYNLRLKIKNGKQSISAFGSIVDFQCFDAKFAHFIEYFDNNLGSASKVSELEAPISGLVTTIHVKEGDTISAGDKLITIEAMKMENLITADFATVIKKINCKAGDSVSVGDFVIDFDNGK
jgi:propionyl-CoA carboxylase alpha chain